MIVYHLNLLGFSPLNLLISLMQKSSVKSTYSDVASKVSRRDEAGFVVSAINGYPVAMEAELSTDVIWSLRALAQGAHAQRELYPGFAVVADELVLDFDAAYSNYKETTQTKHDDLEKLDAHIASKSGVLEFWTDEALEQSDFWHEIRQQAKQALKVRSLTTFAPHPSSHAFVSEIEVWASDSNIGTPLEDTPSSFFKRFLNRFR